jgi:hypothetical protein
MSRYNPYYYILFVLIILSAFASMAQNYYGIKILGTAALAFGLIFLLQLREDLKSKHLNKWVVIAELTGLTVISIILCLRIFFIRFPFVEFIFGVSGLLVIISYVVRIIDVWKKIRLKSFVLTMLLISFLASITSYTISMTIVPFYPLIADPFGVAGFILFIAFVVGGFMQKHIILNGDRITVFSYIAKIRDRSIVLLALFILFTSYIGLTKYDIIPTMYSDQYPQAYFELVTKTETGAENTKQGKNNHEEFKAQYDKFIERHIRK